MFFVSFMLDIWTSKPKTNTMYYFHFIKELTLQNQKLIEETIITRETEILHKQELETFYSHMYFYIHQQTSFFFSYCRILDTSSLNPNLQITICKPLLWCDGLQCSGWVWWVGAGKSVSPLNVFAKMYLSIHIGPFLGRGFVTFRWLSIVSLIPKRIRIRTNSLFQYWQWWIPFVSLLLWTFNNWQKELSLKGYSFGHFLGSFHV